MIVVQVNDPLLRRAVARAASLEEDVITDARLGLDAIEWGFPRLVVRDGEPHRYPLPPHIELLDIDAETRRRWESDRRAEELPLTRVEYIARRVAIGISRTTAGIGSVDRTFAELTRATGHRLPLPLRSFGRRVLEFPYHYRTLRSLAEACGTSRGALKARFRRRGLSSPSTYLRWFRIIAVADLLSDPTVPVAAAAGRLGFTSDGNLCRTMWTATEMTPTELRTLRGWNRLLISFTWQHLGASALEGWASLDELFERKVA